LLQHGGANARAYTDPTSRMWQLDQQFRTTHEAFQVLATNVKNAATRGMPLRSSHEHLKMSTSE